MQPPRLSCWARASPRAVQQEPGRNRFRGLGFREQGEELGAQAWALSGETTLQASGAAGVRADGLWGHGASGGHCRSRERVVARSTGLPGAAAVTVTDGSTRVHPQGQEGRRSRGHEAGGRVGELDKRLYFLQKTGSKASRETE